MYVATRFYGKMTRIGSIPPLSQLVNIIVCIFDSRKPAAQIPKASSFKVAKYLQSPRGWENGQLRKPDRGVHKQKKANKFHKRERSWWEITENHDVLILFGEGFEQVIQPDLAQSLSSLLREPFQTAGDCSWRASLVFKSSVRTASIFY
jgi:hypothetical protein